MCAIIYRNIDAFIQHPWNVLDMTLHVLSRRAATAMWKRWFGPSRCRGGQGQVSRDELFSREDVSELQEGANGVGWENLVEPSKRGCQAIASQCSFLRKTCTSLILVSICSCWTSVSVLDCNWLVGWERKGGREARIGGGELWGGGEERCHVVRLKLMLPSWKRKLMKGATSCHL